MMFKTILRAVREYGRRWVQRRRESNEAWRRMMDGENLWPRRQGPIRPLDELARELGPPPAAWTKKPAKKADSACEERPSE
jgi:hypothetical protein